MGILGKIFTWWDGATIGTSLYTWRNGDKVGEDAFGNRYYTGPNGRRWVIYKGANDASRLTPEWHSWLHHTIDQIPEDAPLTVMPPVRAWEQPATGNLTGTNLAYYPPGALEKGGVRARATGDYEAWSPDGA